MAKQLLVGEFIDAFNLKRVRDGKPTLELVEIKEFTNLLEEVVELMTAYDVGDIVEVIDALVDILYFVYGIAETIGVDLTPFFMEVHRNNMTKMGPNGPEYYPNGKVKKPANYVPVDLRSLYERLYCNG